MTVGRKVPEGIKDTFKLAQWLRNELSSIEEENSILYVQKAIEKLDNNVSAASKDLGDFLNKLKGYPKVYGAEHARDIGLMVREGTLNAEIFGKLLSSLSTRPELSKELQDIIDRLLGYQDSLKDLSRIQEEATVKARESTKIACPSYIDIW